MSPEDVREDLIDNEPSPFADDISVDEKTWDWWASRQPVSETVISAPQINRHLYAPTVAIDFLWTADLLCLLLLSGGTRLDHCVITTKGSASVRHSAIERQRHMDETSINYLAVHRTLKVSPFCLPRSCWNWTGHAVRGCDGKVAGWTYQSSHSSNQHLSHQ